jgi:hypothetical protein
MGGAVGIDVETWDHADILPEKTRPERCRMGALLHYPPGMVRAPAPRPRE